MIARSVLILLFLLPLSHFGTAQESSELEEIYDLCDLSFLKTAAFCDLPTLEINPNFDFFPTELDNNLDHFSPVDNSDDFTSAGNVLVSFEEDQLHGNLARVFEIIHVNNSEYNWSKREEPYYIKRGQNWCEIIIETMEIPMCDFSLAQITMEIFNPKITSPNLIQEGEPLIAPDIEVRELTFGKSPTTYRLTFPFETKDALQETYLKLIEEESLKGINIALLSSEGIRPALNYSIQNQSPELANASCPADNSQKGFTTYFPPGADLSPKPNEPNSLCQGDECPQILLIDTPVHPHPALQGAILETDSETEPTEECSEELDSDDIKVEEHHGTHLAGIMVAQGNGFVGLNPFLKSRLVSENIGRFEIAEKDTTTTFTDKKLTFRFLVDKVMTQTQSPIDIAVFASELQIPEDAFLNKFGNPINKSFLEVASDYDDALAIIKDSEADILWVIAAGSTDGDGIDINENIPLSPMVFGKDSDNVVVVTSCGEERCEPATIAPWANYSTSGFVHLIAPGVNIMSTTGVNSHGVMSGTSQAAAFVGGLVSLMLHYYGSTYDRTYKIKNMLQALSRPAHVESQLDWVTAGVVDPNALMRNPELDWVLPKDGFDHNHEQKTVAGMCIDSIKLANEEIPIGQAKRIYSVENENNVRRWYVFTQRLSSGPVKRVGPGKLEGLVVNKDNPQTTNEVTIDRIYVRLCGDSNCSIEPLADYQDIVLAINNKITPTWFPECAQ